MQCTFGKGVFRCTQEVPAYGPAAKAMMCSKHYRQFYRGPAGEGPDPQATRNAQAERTAAKKQRRAQRQDD